MAVAIAVTQADGDNAAAVDTLGVEFAQVIRFMSPATPGWRPEVLACCA